MHGVMRARVTRLSGVSMRRCMRVEMSSSGVLVGSQRRGAARKAVIAYRRVSATVGSGVSLSGSGRGEAPVVGVGVVPTAVSVAVSAAVSVVGGMTRVPTTSSASMSSVWKKRPMRVGSVTGWVPRGG